MAAAPAWMGTLRGHDDRLGAFESAGLGELIAEGVPRRAPLPARLEPAHGRRLDRRDDVR